MSCKETEIGLIPEDWELYELKDKVNITMGQSPKSEFYNSHGLGMPFMQGRKTFGSKYHTIDTWCTDPKRLAKKGDVLMSVRAPVGDVNIATKDLCIGRGLASLRMYNDNNEFLYYLLKNYVDKIISRETGTVFGSINKKGIETLKLPFPSDREQKAIANILSTLDEKIEINNKINKNLEKMAQTIFKHWFIDFEFPNENGEPYKSSGGEMVESELGMIPKGWEVKELKKVANSITRGQTPKYAEKSDIFVLNQKVNKGDFLEKQYFKCLREDLNVPSEKYAKKWDILLNSLGQGTLGRIHLYKEETDNVVIDQHITIIRFDDGSKYASYVYNLLKSQRYKNILEGLISGSTGMIMLNVTKIRNLKVVVPSKRILIDFDKVVKHLYEKINKNTKENEYLSELRDTLLPKLMSGEIRVPLDN